MAGAVINKAEIEYAVMLAVLDFQTEFMKSADSHVQASVYDELIYVTSARSASIPAEKELVQRRKNSPGHRKATSFFADFTGRCSILVSTCYGNE